MENKQKPTKMISNLTNKIIPLGILRWLQHCGCTITFFLFKTTNGFGYWYSQVGEIRLGSEIRWSHCVSHPHLWHRWGTWVCRSYSPSCFTKGSSLPYSPVTDRINCQRKMSLLYQPLGGESTILRRRRRHLALLEGRQGPEREPRDYWLSVPLSVTISYVIFIRDGGKDLLLFLIIGGL